jgi:hypothetical protein
LGFFVNGTSLIRAVEASKYVMRTVVIGKATGGDERSQVRKVVSTPAISSFNARV